MASQFHWFTPPSPDKIFRPSSATTPFPGVWFEGATVNLCYNALDRHCLPLTIDPVTGARSGGKKDRVALVWESAATKFNAPPGYLPASSSSSAAAAAAASAADLHYPALHTRTFTYGLLHRHVIRLAAALQALGLKRGDRVTFVLPIIPELVIGVLACARLGLVHSVLGEMGGAQALSERLLDARAQCVVTCDARWSAEHGKSWEQIGMKQMVDAAVQRCADAGHAIPRVVVVQHAFTAEYRQSSAAAAAAAAAAVPWNDARDVWYHELVRRVQPASASSAPSEAAAAASHESSESSQSSQSSDGKPGQLYPAPSAADAAVGGWTASDVPCVALRADDVCCILYTSGSTGKPKGGQALPVLSAFAFETIHIYLFLCIAHVYL
jgi:acyl-coenzyme A synthetase/AMP-(fatty) acid ligase